MSNEDGLSHVLIRGGYKDPNGLIYNAQQKLMGYK